MLVCNGLSYTPPMGTANRWKLEAGGTRITPSAMEGVQRRGRFLEWTEEVDCPITDDRYSLHVLLLVSCNECCPRYDEKKKTIKATSFACEPSAGPLFDVGIKATKRVLKIDLEK